MFKYKVLKVNYKLLISIEIIILLMTFSTLLIYNSYATTSQKQTEQNQYNTVTTSKNTNGKSKIAVPIIMYHSVLKSKGGKYIVHPLELENDLKYIKEKGYTTITMTDLINYVYMDKILPEKPIILTFDDGYYNNLSYVQPLLKKYDMKAVISIVGAYTDKYTSTNEANSNYGYFRWKDIKELMDVGNIEFQNHTYNLHSCKNGRNGCAKKLFEPKAKYQKIIYEDIKKLQDEFKEKTNYEPNTFTYPFGAISKDSIDIIRKLGFKATLSCTEGMNYIDKNPKCLYCLKRNNRRSGISTEKFFKKILR